MECSSVMMTDVCSGGSRDSSLVWV